jgi:hypothetical protein
MLGGGALGLLYMEPSMLEPGGASNDVMLPPRSRRKPCTFPMLSVYHPVWGDAGGRSGCGTRHIERGEGAATRPKEAVRHATCIDVRSDDYAARGDGAGKRGCRARWIEGDKRGMRVNQGRVET